MERPKTKRIWPPPTITALLSRDRKHRALVYNCFGQKIGDALKVEIVSTATGEVVASKWDEDLPRCAASCKSAISKTGWDGNTFRVSIGRPQPFDERKAHSNHSVTEKRVEKRLFRCPQDGMLLI